VLVGVGVESRVRLCYANLARAAMVVNPLVTAFPVVQFIESAHPEIKFAQHSLRAALKMGVEKGKLIQTKASYKLSPEEKKPPKKKKVRCAHIPDRVHRVLAPPSITTPVPTRLEFIGPQEEEGRA